MNLQVIAGFYSFDDDGLTSPNDVLLWHYRDVNNNPVNVTDFFGNEITEESPGQA